ncbi:hypothetical protein O0L34_g6013 [Tuta absoluta]|nr:hypothetical protein O0L34_g6013 [Tuta absoluta]
MDEVSDLLIAWGLPDLRANIIKNEIDLQALSALTHEDIKEVMPPLGPRTLFVRNWKAWNPNFSSTTNTTIQGYFSGADNISLSEISVKDFTTEESLEIADEPVVEAAGPSAKTTAKTSMHMRF